MTVARRWRLKSNKDHQNYTRFVKIQTFVTDRALSVHLLPHPPGAARLPRARSTPWRDGAKEPSHAVGCPVLPTKPKMADGLTLTLNSTQHIVKLFDLADCGQEARRRRSCSQVHIPRQLPCHANVVLQVLRQAGEEAEAADTACLSGQC